MNTQDVRLFWKNSEVVENTSIELTGVRIKKVAEKMLTREGEPVNESEFPTYHNHPAKQKAFNIALIVTSRCSRKAERVRRDRTRDLINALDAAEQSEAWTAEWERREIWDQENGELKRKVDP